MTNRRPERKKNIKKEPIFRPPYPLKSLGPILGGAGLYIHLKNQSPAAMCGTSVLAAASSAVQGLVKIRVRSDTTMIVANYFYGEAISGERKSANDLDAFKEHKAFDAWQRKLKTAAQERFRTEMRAWDIKNKALHRQLARLMADEKETAAIEKEIGKHQMAEPALPKRAQILLKNLSPQSVPRHLAEIYPFAIVLGSEGGVAALTLSDTPMLNALWDDGTWSSSRITREDVEIDEAVLSIHVQFPPAQSEKFLKSKALPWENGFMFRCLYYRPESTQGTRFKRYIDLPEGDMQVFHKTMRSLLEEYAQDELPTPIVLTLSSAAKDLLDWLGDKLEAEIAPDGWFEKMKGAAAKAADICARISAVLHRGNQLPGIIVGVGTIRDAIIIVTWHLNQHRMKFCPYTEEELDAIELRDWLYAKVPGLVKQMKGLFTYDGPALSRIVPVRLRGDVDRLRGALKLLEEQEQIVNVFQRVRRPGTGGQDPWDVQFTAWIPPLAPLDRRDMPPLPPGRWSEGRGAPPAPPGPPKTASYELWPGVFLPEH